MALWTSTDGSAGAPKFGQITPAFGSSANGLQLYANTQTGAFITAQATGMDTAIVALGYASAMKVIQVTDVNLVTPSHTLTLVA